MHIRARLSERLRPGRSAAGDGTAPTLPRALALHVDQLRQGAIQIGRTAGHVFVLFLRASWRFIRAAPAVANAYAALVTALATVAMFLATVGYLYLTHRLVVLSNLPSVEVLTPNPVNWDQEEPLLEVSVTNRAGAAAIDVRADILMVCCTDAEALPAAHYPWIRKLPVLESPTLPRDLIYTKSISLKEVASLPANEARAPAGDLFLVVVVDFDRPPVWLLDLDTNARSLFVFDWNGRMQRWNISDSLTRERVLKALSRNGAL